MKRQENYQNLLEELSLTHKFTLISIGNIFCNDSKCFAEKDKQIWYTDDNHIGQEASLYVSRIYDFLD